MSTSKYTPRTLHLAAPPSAVAIRRSPKAAHRAGKTAETVLVAWLRNKGARYAERRLAGARLDKGDVAGIPGVTIEVKCPGAKSPITLAGWLDETMTERDNADADVGLLCVKRRGRGSPSDWYWVTDGDTMLRLLTDAGWVKP